MNKLIPEIVKCFDLRLAMPKEEWKTINYWFVKPEKLPVTVSSMGTEKSQLSVSESASVHNEM